MFLDKTRYSHSASLIPGMEIGTSEFNASIPSGFFFGGGGGWGSRNIPSHFLPMKSERSSYRFSLRHSNCYCVVLYHHIITTSVTVTKLTIESNAGDKRRAFALD